MLLFFPAEEELIKCMQVKDTWLQQIQTDFENVHLKTSIELVVSLLKKSPGNFRIQQAFQAYCGALESSWNCWQK